MPQDNCWVIHCDGTALPNPGRIGIGAVLIAPDGARHQLSLATGRSGCSNEAEARALIAALQEALKLGARTLRIHSDSSVMVEHLVGQTQTVIQRLLLLFDEAHALLAQFEHTELRWLPRHRNTEADALARAALGLAAKPSKLRRHSRKRR